MLTPKQKAFADEYLICGNATEAAKRAGYSQKTAYSLGQRLLKNVEVSAYIAERQQQVENSRIATIAEIEEFYSGVIRGEIKDQFGIDASISDRTAAARELMKRHERAEDARRNTSGSDILKDMQALAEIIQQPQKNRDIEDYE